MHPNFDFSALTCSPAAVLMLMMLMREDRGYGVGHVIQVSLPSL
jgi:hypothetical protein